MVNLHGRGDAEEAYVLMKLLALGYVVSIPYGQRAPYDFLVQTPNHLIKIQVKKIYKDKTQGSYRVDLRKNKRKNTKRRKYTKEDCDYIVAASREMDTCFIMPIEVLAGKCHVTFSFGSVSKYASVDTTWMDKYEDKWF